jgi:hypothetical protein
LSVLRSTSRPSRTACTSVCTTSAIARTWRR